jgi:hypothetical protein
MYSETMIAHAHDHDCVTYLWIRGRAEHVERFLEVLASRAAPPSHDLNKYTTQAANILYSALCTQKHHLLEYIEYIPEYIRPGDDIESAVKAPSTESYPSLFMERR